MEQKQIEYGIIHCHTENSMKDSALSAEDLVLRAKELGAPAITLTDHGNLLGIYEFMNICRREGINGIPGVEAYVQEDGIASRRSHFLLLAKDYAGYQAISKAVTASNKRLDKDVPRMNMDILMEHFGPGTPGHGNVIATSACMGGILAQILLKNAFIEHEIERSENKMKKWSNPNDPAYLEDKRSLQALSEQIRDEMRKRDETVELAKRKFGAKERTLKGVKASGDKEAYEVFRKELEAEKQKTEDAKEALPEIKKELAAMKKRETALRQKCAKSEETHVKWNRELATVNKLKAEMRSERDLKQETVQMAKTLASLFGEGNFYIELQYHGIPEEAKVMPVLAKIAEQEGLPIVAANDVHFARNSKEDIRARQIIRSLRFNQWEEERAGDLEYYIKTDAQLKEALQKILPKKTVERALEGVRTIADACRVEFPHTTHFPAFHGDGCETAKDRLRRMSVEAIPVKYGTEWSKDHQDRLEYELSVIEDLGYSDYLCIVEDFLRYGRRLGTNNPENVGLGIGPGRGSACGSLVCYLTGITNVDPMHHDLIFERFLNRDRVSMPDIDSDFHTEIREQVIRYVKEAYGEEAVCNITTKTRLAAKAAVRNAARIYGSEKYGDTKQFLGLGDRIAKVIPMTPGIRLADCEEALKAFDGDKDARQIIADARLVEGVAIQTGMHAAGVIIADNGDVSDYVPLLWNTDKQRWCTQCDMVQAESDAGLLKMDFLGLNNLDIITETLRTIKRVHGVTIDIEAVGNELKADGRNTTRDIRGNTFDEIFAKGKTNGVFQFESNGMKEMLKKFKPRNIDDLTLLVACYRPGPMQFLGDIIDVKFGRKKPDYCVPEMEEMLGSTYGYPVFQEQVMQICHRVAGLSLGESDIVRRAMSKKKLKELVKYRAPFIDGLCKAGATKAKAEAFWESLLDFSKYAFNKSHACAYAYVAFYTAWLKLNYPAEYMTALLNHSKQEKLTKLVAECREMGIRVLPPNVNESQMGFSYRDGDILFGLNCIKGVGNAVESLIAIRDRQPFRSFKDFILRGHQKKNITYTLIDCGAMDVWCFNRTAMKLAAEPLWKDAKKIKEKLAQLETERDEKKRASINRKLEEYRERFEHTVLPISIPEDTLDRLTKEHELLGMYVSGHPLDEYEKVKTLRTCPVSEAYIGKLVLCGAVTEVRQTNRKKDGAPMAFFTLEDESGSIEMICFAKAFEQIGDLIREGNVLKVTGQCRVRDESGEEEEEEYVLYANQASLIERTRKKVVLSVPDLAVWAECLAKEAELYEGDDYELLLHDKMLSELRPTDLCVCADFLNADLEGADIRRCQLLGYK